MMNWERAYDIKASMNVRGENVYDVYRKGTQEMLWADIPVEKIDEFLKGMVRISEIAAAEELDALFTIDAPEPKAESKPMTVTYERLRGYDSPFGPVSLEEDKDESD